MFFKKQQAPAGGALITKNAAARRTPPSVISSDVNILGNVLSDGFLDIDGRVEGNVKCNSVTIRPNGKIRGDVIAEHVQIYGEVKGLVKAKTVQLFSTCRVVGVIMHEQLAIEDGAFVDGKFKRTDKLMLDESADDLGIEENRPESDSRVSMLENLRLISANE